MEIAKQMRARRPFAGWRFVVMMTGHKTFQEAAMMPYQTYQLYQIERPKTVTEIRYADDRAGRTAATLAGMLRLLKPAAPHQRQMRAHTLDRPFECGKMTATMEAR